MFVTFKWKFLIIMFIVIIKKSLQDGIPAPDIGVQAQFENREVHSFPDLALGTDSDRVSTMRNPKPAESNVSGSLENMTNPKPADSNVSGSLENTPAPDTDVQAQVENREVHSFSDLALGTNSDHVSTMRNPKPAESNVSGSLENTPAPDIGVQAQFENREVHSFADLALGTNSDHVSTMGNTNPAESNVPETHENKAVSLITNFDVKIIVNYIMTSTDDMLQADIKTGNKVNKKVKKKPKAGIAWLNHEDSNFEELINEWKKTDRKLKLNFKSTDAFLSAIPKMMAITEELKAQNIWWLHGDILVGPGPGDSPKLDAHTFIKNVKEKFPKQLLSLGWTTKKSTNDDDNNNEKYTMQNIKEMIQVVADEQYTKPVNYVVRASYAANSYTELIFLLDHEHRSSAGSFLTLVYYDPNDVINYPKLVDVIKDIGLDRVYFDVPNWVSQEFDEHFYKAEEKKKIGSVNTGAERAGTDWDFGKIGLKMFNV